MADQDKSSTVDFFRRVNRQMEDVYRILQTHQGALKRRGVGLPQSTLQHIAGLQQELKTIEKQFVDGQNEAERMRILLDYLGTLYTTSDLDALLDYAIDAAMSLVSGEHGFILLNQSDGESTDLHIVQSRGVENLQSIPLSKLNHHILDYVVESGQPTFIDSSYKNESSSDEAIASLQLFSVLCLPLQHREHLIGVIYLSKHFRNGLFRPADLQMMVDFCEHLSQAIAHV